MNSSTTSNVIREMTIAVYEALNQPAHPPTFSPWEEKILLKIERALAAAGLPIVREGGDFVLAGCTGDIDYLSPVGRVLLMAAGNTPVNARITFIIHGSVLLAWHREATSERRRWFSRMADVCRLNFRGRGHFIAGDMWATLDERSQDAIIGILGDAPLPIVYWHEQLIEGESMTVVA